MTTNPESTMMSPQIEKLMDRTKSKFSLVTLAARRARDINSYFNQLSDGLGRQRLAHAWLTMQEEDAAAALARDEVSEAGGTVGDQRAAHARRALGAQGDGLAAPGPQPVRTPASTTSAIRSGVGRRPKRGTTSRGYCPRPASI